jgi:Histidine kinase-, DNA gyrase B-, and HSP90-like ATPase
VCESHNLNDLDNIKKYKLSQPYGNTEAETVNLQFCSVLLRTADLLQVTRHRAPSVLYRFINPTDPISQIEWIKQNAVRRIRPKPGKDRDGNISPDVQSDTIEVFASLHNQNGFFGLTSYLRYAAEQIQRSYELVEKSKKHSIRKYSFPWRYIDDSNVEAEGFEKQTFGFEIDQSRVLDLLTGHTLYNDSGVVLRELVQNAIDAVRLQATTDGADPTQQGKISISWSSSLNELTIIDNGTGMTQDVIEKHLLRVGSSRYQDPKFREKFPTFYPISRFGIGVLSSFMVADSVEITTCSLEDEVARQISLRSVHGKYLIRLLDKAREPGLRQLLPHGTRFTLKLRPSARKIDVLSTLRRWILFPRCDVTVIIDDAAPEHVGYRSPKEALETYLASSIRNRFRNKVKVEERNVNGITIAYGLSYDSHYRDWSFVAISEQEDSEPGATWVPVGTCIEGIAVEFDTPGYRGRSILAIANATGANAPRTNVARSSIEDTSEKADLFRECYRTFYGHVAGEAERLRADEAYSLTWATEQVPFLAGSLMHSPLLPSMQTVHVEALAELPMFLVETETSRVAASLTQLCGLKEFWTVESQLVRSVEHLIREAQAELTTRKLMSESQRSIVPLPPDHLVANLAYSRPVTDIARSRFELVGLIGHVSDRRIDLRWGLRGDTPRWYSDTDLWLEAHRRGLRQALAIYRQVRERASGHRSESDISFPICEASIEGLDNYIGVVSGRAVYLLPGTTLVQFLARFANLDNDEDIGRLISYLEVCKIALNSARQSSTGAISGFERGLRFMDTIVTGDLLSERQEFLAVVAASAARLQIFDPFSWGQREIEQIEYF